MIILTDKNKLPNISAMEDVTEATESEVNQATDKKPAERTEMNKKPTSGKELQNESEEKVLKIFIYIHSYYYILTIPLIKTWGRSVDGVSKVVLSIIKNPSTKF